MRLVCFEIHRESLSMSETSCCLPCLEHGALLVESFHLVIERVQALESVEYGFEPVLMFSSSLSLGKSFNF